MPEYNAMIKDIGHVSLDFSAVLMYLLYSIQQTIVGEMKKRECVVFNQLNQSKNTVTSLENKVKET